VAVFRVRDFRRGIAPRPNSEIVDGRFFPLDQLPDDTSPATRARIAEFRNGAPASQHW
jgi:hypothetical protein